MNETISHPPGRHYDVGRRRLWVEQEGQGEPVLLLSGLGPAGSHLVFHPNLSQLAEDHRVTWL
jgi:proline iminopeptidase